MAEFDLPREARAILGRLHGAGYQAFVVGGAVRDHLRGCPPVDIDVATDATPDAVLALFPSGRADGAAFGRVLVGGTDVLTLRREGVYRDHRRPSSVVFTDDIAVDLARRDFTMNAIAWRYPDGAVIDPFGGRAAIEGRRVEPVGDPDERLGEDALRILRAVRFAAVFGFSLTPPLEAAMPRHARELTYLAGERVRDEFTKLLLAHNLLPNLERMRDWGVLAAIIPEFAPAFGCAQRTPRHCYDVFTHCAVAAHYSHRTPAIRLAALFHDIAKPACKAPHPSEDRDTFYGHEIEGAEVTERVLRRLAYPERLIRQVRWLVRHHMFTFREETKLSAARRLLIEAEPEWALQLIEVRRADRMASLHPPGPGRDAERLLAALRRVLDEGSAISRRALAVDGHDVMERLGIGPGPRVGEVLRRLHDEVLEDPRRNERARLLRRIDAFREWGGSP